jgi:hypothetical protein
MNSFLIKIFGFFLGLLIISILISFIKVKESFSDTITVDNLGAHIDDNDLQHRILKLKSFDLGRFDFGFNLPKIGIGIKSDDDDDKKDKKEDDDSSDEDDYENDKLNLPYKGFKYICINTFKDINKLKLSKGRWYDIDNESDSDSDDEQDDKDKKCRKKKYFKFNKTLVLRKNLLNNKIGAMGADITGIQLNGPECYYFANNNKNYELTEFSMFMSVYIISCEKNSDNIIFEMTGNTEKINNDYTTNIININLLKNSTDNYDIHITIGNNMYDTIANNIDKNIIEKNNNLLIGLLYSKDKISLVINNTFYDTTNKNKMIITLGSKPALINKDGNISMYLYNFVYYKSLFTNVNALIRYNIYYLSGLNNKNCPITSIDDKNNKTNHHHDTKINKFKIPKVKFNYNDDDDSDNIKKDDKKDDKNKTCPNKFNFNIKPTIDRIENDIELNIKNKVDGIKDFGMNIGGKIDDIGMNIGGKINDIGMNIGGKINDVGMNIGGKINDVGMNIGGKINDIGVSGMNIGGKINDIGVSGMNIGGKFDDIKNNIGIKGNLDRIKSDIETNMKDKTIQMPSVSMNDIKIEQQQETPSFFKRLFNFF